VGVCVRVQATADPSPIVATAAKAALDAAELPVSLLRMLLAAAADNQPRYKKPHHSRTQPTSNAQASASPLPMGAFPLVHERLLRGRPAVVGAPLIVSTRLAPTGSPSRAMWHH
jgi:hypothetical protein